MVEPARFIVVMAYDKAKEGSFVPAGACLRGNAAMFKDGYRLVHCIDIRCKLGDHPVPDLA
ncbi:hypothetical protein FHS21_004525 [Phyllobacterium trifolii]|uniref:Uncharacterized protein n=1 Tax=Phyllobacterium trifolii TaxID=300193 RepID=A0A839UH09_9HYPH|nr:hypothetical protein [Phyllobacterium trifolii]MBB3148082.1 hypothetical protein [Phyllobacterium trifolii]